MNMNKIVLLDFDGVVADSFQCAFETQKGICPHITSEEYKKRFEGNLNDWKEVESGHTEDCRVGVDFFSEYIPRMKAEVQIFSGMKEVVEQLASQYRIVTISSTLSAPIEEFLDRHGIRNCFADIFGNDVHKSKTVKIGMVFEKYGVTAADCVFITDTVGDIHEAKQMEVDALGVAWGFHSASQLLNAGAYAIVEDPGMLTSAIGEYFKNEN